MRKKLCYLLSITVIVLCSTFFMSGCAELIGEDPPTEPIVAERNYYINALIPNTFVTSDGRFVTMATNPHTHIRFDETFQTMSMHFDMGQGQSIPYITFIVTQLSLAGNNINASLERVFQGNILRYTVTSNANYIFIYTATTQVVSVVTNDHAAPETVTIQPHVRALTFMRHTPTYIVTPGGGG